ncbi:MAG: clostripain family protease [Alistipes sp.]|nr:clostripain family protease [Alistipes sp.]
MKRPFRTAVCVLLLLALGLTSCHRDEEFVPRRPRPETADQTLLFYLTGTDLSAYFRQNIDAMMSAIDRDILYDSRVLVFVEGQKNRPTILELNYAPNNANYDPAQPLSHAHAAIDTLYRWEAADFNSMERSTIAGTLRRMAEAAPAHRYGVIFGGHGLGWLPAESTAPYAVHDSAADPWTPLPDALPTRWLGDPRKRASIPDLGEALRETGLRFEYLIFDACFMSSVEALYELRESCRYIVASPCEIMASGFAYDEILPDLLCDGGRSYDLPRVCRDYYDYYANRAQTPSGCIALTDTSELEALAAIVREIETRAARPCDPAPLQTYEGLADHVFFDLGDYIAAVCDDAALLAEFERQMARTFPEESRRHTPSFYSAYGRGSDPQGMHPIRSYSGVTTSAPCARFAAEWQQTAWYRTTH